MLRKGEIDGKAYTFEEIGKLFGFSRQYAHQVFIKGREDKTSNKNEQV